MPEADRKPKVDWSKPTKWEEQAQQQDAKDAATRAQAEKIFNLKDLLQKTRQIHEVNHPLLGIVRYCDLTLGDTVLLEACKTKRDLTLYALYLMLKRANPDLPAYSAENIGEFGDALPLLEGAALLEFVSGSAPFLSDKPASKPGSQPTQKPSKSA